MARMGLSEAGTRGDIMLVDETLPLSSMISEDALFPVIAAGMTIVSTGNSICSRRKFTGIVNPRGRIHYGLSIRP